jgi:hypothetical protein
LAGGIVAVGFFALFRFARCARSRVRLCHFPVSDFHFLSHVIGTKTERGAPRIWTRAVAEFGLPSQPQRALFFGEGADDGKPLCPNEIPTSSGPLAS